MPVMMIAMLFAMLGSGEGHMGMMERAMVVQGSDKTLVLDVAKGEVNENSDQLQRE